MEHFWCTDKPWANIKSQDSPRPGFGGSHHLPPYSIFCAWPWGLHPNVILSQDSQFGSPKIPKIRSIAALGPITFCINLWLKWGLKQSCSHHQELSNGMWHHLHASKSKRFLTFNGRESNWHFDSRLFFWP